MIDILVVEDEPEIRHLMAEALRDLGHRVRIARDGAEALAQLEDQVFDLVVSDVRLPRADGFAILHQARKKSPSTEVVLVTAYSTVADAVRAMKERAVQYLAKPFDLDDLLKIAEAAAERQQLKADLAHARSQLAAAGAHTTLLGKSPAMVALQERIEMIAASDLPVLLSGESGTGKDLVARTIHERSQRRNAPFVAVNCAAFPETLLEAELFGHERGAFTGAFQRREGRFNAADGGTLFLDEVTEMPQAAQAKLLRVLEKGEFQPLGTNQTLRVNVRIVSATNHDIKQMMGEGGFRVDLNYRLDGVHLHIPPLRERRTDVPILVEHFLHRFAKVGSQPPAISPRAWAALTQYDYPGNVRELEHAIKHALVLGGGGEIDLHHLPQDVRGSGSIADVRTGKLRPLALVLGEYEREYLLRALEANDWSRTRTAELLGISTKSLWEKLRHHGIQKPDTRPPARRFPS